MGAMLSGDAAWTNACCWWKESSGLAEILRVNNDEQPGQGIGEGTCTFTASQLPSFLRKSLAPSLALIKASGTDAPYRQR
jgi:hypothetical protein